MNDQINLPGSQTFGRGGGAEPGPWGGSSPRATSPATAEIKREPFKFHGTAKEYFGIWIVNILLTIITLGIYSAWAKVRRLRYFYGNTELAGATFDYHAQPKQILVGRIIVLVLLGIYNVVGQLFPIFGLLLLPVFLLAAPWFIFRGIRFSARVTSYRNVRFDFKGSYGGAFLAYIVGPILAVLSFGILIPFASRWAWRYQLNNLRYGDRPITSNPLVKAFYGQLLVPFLIVLGLAILGPVGAMLLSSGQDLQGDEGVILLLTLMTPILVVIFLFYSVLALIYGAGSRNVAFSATVVDARHRLVSFMGRRRYAWIVISNLIVTILTLGLARPWAAVRMTKYLCATTALDVSGRLDDFVSSIKETGGVVGAEFMDFEGFDLGL